MSGRLGHIYLRAILEGIWSLKAVIYLIVIIVMAKTSVNLGLNVFMIPFIIENMLFFETYILAFW